MRRSGAAGGFGGRTAPRMTRNAKARDVLEVILTIVLRCEPTERDARLGKGERGGFGGSAEVRRPGAETCAHLISEPSQPGGSTARSIATARPLDAGLGTWESRPRGTPPRPIRPGKSKRGHGEGCALT